MIDFTSVHGFVKVKNILALVALFCVMNTFAMSPNPEDVISTITQEILSEIKNNPSLVKGDCPPHNTVECSRVTVNRRILGTSKHYHRFLHPPQGTRYTDYTVSSTKYIPRHTILSHQCSK